MSFLEQEFPTSVSFGASGGPAFNTTVNEGFSGFEQRNQNWAIGRGQWSVDLAHKDSTVWQQAYNFWLVAAGKANSFRFKDHKDFQATAQFIADGSSAHPVDGSNKQFQLIKTYTIGGNTYTKPIQKPITASVKKADGTNYANTVTIYDNGVAVGGGAVSIDHTTGVITFTSAPTSGHTITADFQFHYPVRFNMDDIGGGSTSSSSAAQIDPSSSSNRLITWSGIMLIEIKIALAGPLASKQQQKSAHSQETKSV